MIMEQQDYKRNRNEEGKNDIEKETDCEYEKKVIKLNIKKMLTRNRLIQKVHVKLLN